MKFSLKVVALVGSIGVLGGCNALKEKLEAARDAAPSEAEADQAAAASTVLNPDGTYLPCEVLPDALVKRSFAELSAVEFETSDTLKDLNDVAAGKGKRVPKERSEYRRESMLGMLCNYSWPKADAEAIRQRNAAKSQEAVKRALNSKKGTAGGLLDALSIMESDRHSVNLALARSKPHESATVAKQAYESRLAALRKGIEGGDLNTNDLPGVPRRQQVDEALKNFRVPPDATLTAVTGVGDAATWSEQSRTLHVLSGAHVFSINVDLGAAVNRAKAVEVARAVTERL